MTAFLTIKVQCADDERVHVHVKDEVDVFDDFELGNGQQMALAISGQISVHVDKEARP